MFSNNARFIDSPITDIVSCCHVCDCNIMRTNNQKVYKKLTMACTNAGVIIHCIKDVIKCWRILGLWRESCIACRLGGELDHHCRRLSVKEI